MRTFALTALLLTLAGFARADDDPEPRASGTAALRKLKGKWVSVRQLAGGKEKAYEGMNVYTFDGDKATYSHVGRPALQLKFEADRKHPNAFRLSRDDGKTANNYFFEFVKGELHLTVNRSNDPDAKADFSGKTMPVTIYKRE